MKKRHESFRIRKYTRRYNRETGKFTIDIAYETATEITPRTIAVAEAFGIGIEKHRRFKIYDNLELKIGPRDIIYITGESGSGKTTLLKALEKDLGEEATNIDKIQLDPEKPIIETLGKTVEEGLRLLSRVGLNDAYLFVRRYRELSDGQKYRYRIAKLIESERQWWMMDEFCSTLDRETAKIVAFNVQKQARRTSRAVIAATTHMDLLEDLVPSVHIHKGWGRRIQVRYFPNRPNEVCSVTRGLRIEEGTLKDYKQLAEFHYRNPETRPVPIKIYKLKRDGDDVAIGVILYSYPPPQCFGRTEAFGRRVPLEEVNEKMATISRVILHPKYRSIGLGVRLVEETLPLIERQYVEATAVMAQYNRFFEKAGMTRITETCGDESIMKAIGTLGEIGFKPYALPSIEANLQHLKELSPEDLEGVKVALSKVSPCYYKRLRAAGAVYAKKEEFSRFIRGSSLETIAKVLSRLAVLSQRKVYLLWRRS